MENFIDSIIKNLEQNGFPDKKVSLPLEKMYEIAEEKGLNFNQVLEKIKSDKGIDSKSEGDRIIFDKVQAPSGLNMDHLNDMFSGMDQGDMMKKAQDAMAAMTPEQMAEMKKMFENMSPEEQQNLMKKGKDMGLV